MGQHTSERAGNDALRDLIEQAGCSHARLAARVNELAALQQIATRYTKASVTRWIRGEQPRDRAPQFIAGALSEFLSRTVTPTDLGYIGSAPMPIAARAALYRDDVAETLHTLAELGSLDITRRSLLGDVPFTAAALLDPQRRWLLWLLEDDHANSLAAAADNGPVVHVHAMIAMFDEMDNRFGGAGVRTSIVDYLATSVVPLLQRRGLSASQRCALFTAGAKLAAMAGWCSYDAAEYGLAQRYMVQGLRLCAEGGDRVLGGQILAGLSHLTTSLGHPDEGIALARAGLATARRAGSPLGQMRLHAMAARGHAALGHPRETAAALRQAENAAASSTGPGQEAPWVRFLDHHYFEAEAALCHRDLNNPRTAERLAAASAEANTDRRRRQAISRSVLATALLQQHRLDEALDTATSALNEISAVHSERCVQAMRDFRERLTAHSDEQTVRAFERHAQRIIGPAA